jgi:hypothetical protein
MLDKYVVEIIDNAIGLLLQSEQKQITPHENTVRWISTEKVLAVPWHLGRLKDSTERLAKGEQAPAIDVELIMCRNNQSFYRVGDGHHRTAAAAHLGYPKIKARISEEVVISADIVLFQEDHSVWERTGFDSLRLIEKNVERAVITCLQRRFNFPLYDSLEGYMGNPEPVQVPIG